MQTPSQGLSMNSVAAFQWTLSSINIYPLQHRTTVRIPKKLVVGFLTGIVVMFSFFGFLSQLSSTIPAFQITLKDSPDNLALRLNKLAAAWTEQATFPTTLKPHFSS